MRPSPAPRARRHGERGTATAEFAVITPLLFLVLFGTLEFGRMVICRQMLAYATIEGARTASMLGTTAVSDVTDQVIAASPLLSLATTDIVVSDLPGPDVDAAAMGARTPGSTITVTVTYNFTPAINLGGLGSGSRTWVETQTAVVQ